MTTGGDSLFGHVDAALLSAVLDAVRDGILVIDRDYRVVLANGRARTMARVERVGPGVRCHMMTHGRERPCDSELEPCPLRRIAETRAPLVVTHTHFDSQDTPSFVEISATPIFDEAGEVSHIVEICRDVTERKQIEARLHETGQLLASFDREREGMAEKVEALTAELVQAEQRERRRVAELLHDHLQQLLVGARFAVTAMRARPQERELLTARVDAALEQAIGVTRSLTIEMSPSAPLDSGLGPALGWLASTVMRQHGLVVRVEADSAAEPEDEKGRLLLLHAVREALFNVIKHAGVRHAEVSMRLCDGQTQIVVADHGSGFDTRLAADSGTGLGLPAIARRLQQLGGALLIDSEPGSGTRVVLTMPLSRAVASG